LTRSRRTNTARLALAAVLAGALLAAPTAASARGLQTGFLDPGAISHQRFAMDPSLAVQKVQEAGGKYVRLYLYWRAVVSSQSHAPTLHQQAQPGIYNWNEGGLNDTVNAAVGDGLKVMLTVRSAPNYAQRGGHDSRGTHNPDPKMFAAFLKAATKHFKGKVFLWGIWNEPNSPQFLTPQYRNGHLVSPGLYENLLKAATPVVYNADSANKIVAGETSPFGHTPPRGHNPSPLVFLRKLLCMSGRSSPKPISCNPRLRADYWTTHPYTSGSPWHHAFNPDDISYGDVPVWKRLVAASIRAGHLGTRSRGKGVHYWLDEFSWDTKAPDPDAVPLQLHARWTSEALYRAWTFGVDALFWGQLRDYPLSEAPYQSGLYFCDTTPTLSDPCSDPLEDPQPQSAKPSLLAFEFPFVAYKKDGRIKVWGKLPPGAGGPVAIKHGSDTIKTLSVNGDRIFSGSFASSLKTGSLVAHAGGGFDSKGFSLVRPKDRFVNPFGCGGGIPC
jgi:hypothetical protein